jgi:hypothetical protein
MALSPAPHPPSVFRYLKQPWREFLLTGGGYTLTIATPAGQAAANPLTVTGTVAVDPSVPLPVPVTVTLTQAATVKATQIVGANVVTGAWSVTFPGATLVAGSATASADTDYGAPINSAAFTMT